MPRIETVDGDLEKIFITEHEFIDQYVTTGKLWMWGYNGDGQLGVNNTTAYYSPVQTGSVNAWKMISGSQHTAAIRTDNTLWTWGENAYGALGQNDSTSRSNPTQVITGGYWYTLAVGQRSMGGIKTNGTLWMWGQNNSYQLGITNSTNRSSPVQVGTATTWKGIRAGSNSYIALKTDGTMWSWGYNGYGQLGLGDTTTRSTPVQIGSSTLWSKLPVQGGHGGGCHAAIQSDGTLWTWGDNAGGQLGLGDTTNRSTPTKVGSDTNWKCVSITSGGSSSGIGAAVKTDGTLWCWGYNGDGALGTNDRTSRSSPVQTVAGGTTWKTVSVEGRGLSRAVGAIKTDSSMWVWGVSSTYGQMGTGAADVRYSSPIQLSSGGTNWKSIAMLNNAGSAITF